MTPTATDTTATRPRVAGEREHEILEATLDVLAEVGYDRLTMDAVATAARASKATLYRRWSSKASLVIEALLCEAVPGELPDTGSLRGDLMATFCVPGGLVDDRALAVFTSVLTATGRDPEFAEMFRREFIAPKAANARAVFERARARGEVADGVDLDLLTSTLPAVVVHRLVSEGQHPDADAVARVIDQIVMPAARCRGCYQSPLEGEKADS